MIHASNISYNNATRQVSNSHYYAVALNYEKSIKTRMSIKDQKQDVAARQRAAIKRVMNRLNLKILPWCNSAGITEGSLRAFLKGDNNAMGSDNLELLANAVGLSLGALLDEPVMTVICGYVGAGERVYCYDDHAKGAGLEEIEVPFGLPNGVVAVVVRGDSMQPQLEEGWVLFYERAFDGVPDECIESLCVVKLADDGMLVKKVKRGSKPHLYHLISKNPLHPPLFDQELQWATKVLHIKLK